MTTSKHSNNSSARKPNREERVRRNQAKNAALAEKKATSMTFEEYAPRYVSAVKGGESASRIADIIIRDSLGHDKWWTVLEWEPAKGSNEEATRKRLLEFRATLRQLATDKGLSNVNKPFSDAMQAAKARCGGGGTREPKPTTQVAREQAGKLYVKIMKMDGDSVTEKLLEANKLFAAAFVLLGGDLQKLNEKL